MHASHRESDTTDRLVRSRPLRLFAVLMAVTLFGVVVGGVTASIGDSNIRPRGTTGMLDVAPAGVIHPSDVPANVLALYQGAHAHREIYEQVPCFCGCETMLGHRHLYDCFMRADGSWEAHAVGCGVCLGEADQIEELLAAGETDPSVIRTAVVAAWGDPYQTK
ncbi:MAG TPA: PCYCGC motif-containing (lipo)protein [Acidimicrobiia bacterium]|nr:PCYCGC motif-containing (lipo)protein [Acidimicrobiia bacterium]